MSNNASGVCRSGRARPSPADPTNGDRDALAKSKLPAVYPFREYIDVDGLVIHGANLGILFERAADYVDRILKGAKPADAGTARYRIRADRCLASRAIVARLREPFGRPAPFRKPPCCAVILITRYFLDFFTGLKIGVRDKSQSILEIGRDELRDLSTTPWRNRRVPKDLEQVGDRREIGIRLSGRRERFALPRLASDRCSVARAFRATGALSKTPVLRGHLDNLIFFRLFHRAKEQKE